MRIIGNDVLEFITQAVLMDMLDLIDEQRQLLLDTIRLTPDLRGNDAFIIITQTGEGIEVLAQADRVDHGHAEAAAGNGHEIPHFQSTHIFQCLFAI